MFHKKTRKALVHLALWGFILGIWRGYVAVPAPAREIFPGPSFPLDFTAGSG